MGERQTEDLEAEGSSPPRGTFTMHGVPMKKRIVSMLSFADSFTIVNGLLGLFSIFLAISGEMGWAASFILLAVLADGMDGVVARRSGKFGSEIGEYMDEFSDMISFCSAPLIFVYITYGASFDLSLKSISILFSCGMFILGGMLHLIRYHMGDENYFVGLATPAAAITAVGVSFLNFPWWAVVVSIFILSVLMMSNIPYPKFDKILAIPAVIVIFLAIFLGGEGYAAMLAGVFIYIILGPLYEIYISKLS